MDASGSLPGMQLTATPTTTETTMKDLLKPGDHLPGVKIILFATQTADHLQTVLAYWKDNEPSYVIWQYHLETGGLGSGSYFSDPEKAATEYFKRTRRET